MEQAVGVFCEFQTKLLYLRYPPLKPQRGRWGLPGGRVERNDDIPAAMTRELREETGILASGFPLFREFHNLSSTLIPYRFHLFVLKLASEPLITLSPEHDSYAWVTAEEAAKLPLAHNADQGLAHYISQLHPPAS